jgi:uncharacterized protein with PQ loop repeat
MKFMVFLLFYSFVNWLPFFYGDVVHKFTVVTKQEELENTPLVGIKNVYFVYELCLLFIHVQCILNQTYMSNVVGQ